MSSVKEFFYWAWFSPGRDFAHAFWEGDGGFDQAVAVVIFSIMLVGVIAAFYRLFKFSALCCAMLPIKASQRDFMGTLGAIGMGTTSFILGWAGFTWTTNAMLLGLFGLEWRGIYINFF